MPVLVAPKYHAICLQSAGDAMKRLGSMTGRHCSCDLATLQKSANVCWWLSATSAQAGPAVMGRSVFARHEGIP